MRPVTAVDLVLIARATALEPWDFLVLRPAEDPHLVPGPFALGSGPARHVLALAEPCPFRLVTRHGSAYCALSAVRPVCTTEASPADLEIHATVAAGWNDFAARWPDGDPLTLHDLGRYVLDAASVLAGREGG
ncbi:hypothetical protein [Longispora albida]|uniref:hypothetical protein n=1 Tax=Longispora albida TaxID=203523 RepID=UPI00036DBAD6|nr:hypothetical protein [Longispora albida]